MSDVGLILLLTFGVIFISIAIIVTFIVLTNTLTKRSWWREGNFKKNERMKLYIVWGSGWGNFNRQTCKVCKIRWSGPYFILDDKDIYCKKCGGKWLRENGEKDEW